MKDDFLISVITPFYNGNKYIKCLFNVLGKNYDSLKEKYPNAEMELIIVNDSPEVEIVVPDLKTYFSYKVIKHELNYGIQQARVTGLNNCEGDYILFLDQDDELLNNAIVSQVEKIFQKNADMVICNAYMEKSDGSSCILYKSNEDFNRLTDLQFYLKSHNVIKSPGQCLVKKEIIPAEWKKFIMKKNGSDDLFLWILLLEKECRIVINKEPQYIHKFTGENLSESEEKMTISSLEIVEFLKNVDYVPKEHVDLLYRARMFSFQLRKGNLLDKIKEIWKNNDIFFYLVINKIKRGIS